MTMVESLQMPGSILLTVGRPALPFLLVLSLLALLQLPVSGLVPSFASIAVRTA